MGESVRVPGLHTVVGPKLKCTHYLVTVYIYVKSGEAFIYICMIRLLWRVALLFQWLGGNSKSDGCVQNIASKKIFFLALGLSRNKKILKIKIII